MFFPVPSRNRRHNVHDACFSVALNVINLFCLDYTRMSLAPWRSRTCMMCLCFAVLAVKPSISTGPQQRTRSAMCHAVAPPVAEGMLSSLVCAFAAPAVNTNMRQQLSSPQPLCRPSARNLRGEATGEHQEHCYHCAWCVLIQLRCMWLPAFCSAVVRTS